MTHPPSNWYKAVITFVALCVTPFSAHAAGVVELPATGQTASYAKWDDGYLKKGVAAPGSRFSDGSDGTVSDGLTGLVWLKNAHCTDTAGGVGNSGTLSSASSLKWSNALASGLCGLTDGSKAGDWRLPNVDELASLYDYSKANPATSGLFTNLVDAYWSSSSYSGDQTQAWYASLQNPGVGYSPKGTAYAVLPVRGGAIVAGSVVDTTAPTIQAFTLPAAWDSLTVPIRNFNVVDLQGVAAYFLSESSTAPSAGAAGWLPWVGYPYYPYYLLSYTFGSAGQHTLYAWVKDAAGNVSSQASSTVAITLPGNVGAVPSTGVKIPATGQTSSYASNDDGDLRKGVAAPVPRFATTGLWTVEDATTGLSWVQAGNLMALRNPAYDADGTVGDGVVTWQHALNYVKKLNAESYLGHTDWRLPNVDELASLYDYSKANPATSGLFTNLGEAYWSSSSYSGDQTQAWYASLRNPGLDYAPKGTAYAVLPVRGGMVQTVASLLIVKPASATGTGTVSSTPAGIACGSSCGMLFDHTGDAFNLSASADAGSAFTGWSGACSGTGACPVTLTGDIGVSAFFNKLRTVTINKSGTGDAVMTSAPAGLNCGAACSAQFPDTASVVITAQLPITSVVASWTGCDASTATQCTITVNGADRQVGVFLASKNLTTLSLSLSSSAILNNGSVIASGKLTRLPDSGFDLTGKTVTVTITPPAGGSLQPFAVTATTDATGHYSTAPIAGFTLRGAYLIQASTAGTSDMIAAASPVPALMVGAQAGYAIIVQGEYPITHEGLAEHQKTTNRIYNALKARGFTDDTIHYLSYQDPAIAAAAGITVDGVPSSAAVRDAIKVWAQKKISDVSAPLWIMMVDHGTNGNFYINNETITPADLDGWLTDLETATKTTDPRIVIDGSCYSGTFVPVLAKQGRVVISSAAADEASYRGPMEVDGIRSGEYFLDNLFSQLALGLTLKDAFNTSSQNTHVLTNTGGANGAGVFSDTVAQHPLIDDTATGQGSAYTSNSGDGALSSTIYLGIGQTISNAGEPADIGGVTLTTILTPRSADPSLWLSTYGSASFVDTAWVEVRSPSFALKGAGQGATMQQIVDLPKLPMSPSGSANRWKAVAAPYAGTTFAGFATPGTYDVFYYTQDQKGTIYTKRGVIYRQSASNSPPDPFDLSSPADGSTQRSVLLLSWNPTADPDGDPLTYTVSVSHDQFITVDYVQEGLTQPVAAIGLDAALSDLTTYYWQVTAIDQYGGVRYSTQIWSFKTNNTNGLPGVLTGYLRSDGGSPITGATIKAGNTTAKTQSNGGFLMVLPTGSYNVSVAAAAGYQLKSISPLLIRAGVAVDASMSLTPLSTVQKPGDCNRDGAVDATEVQNAVGMFLGVKQPAACVDLDGNNAVSASEMQKTINGFQGH